MKNKVIFIVGPTSSGKSKVAARLAGEIDGQIISCDSMQVYKDMDIITQAPSEDLTFKIRHHLIRELSPEEEFSAANFSEKASDIIKTIISEDNIPIVAGGTGLYVKALIDGLFEGPSKHDDIRNELNDLADSKGAGCLYNELRKIDPESADKIHPNDKRRIIRALEVYRITGIKISEKKKDTEGIYDKYDCIIFGLDLPRKILYERINLTVDRMIDAGLIEEVKSLLERKLSLTAKKALGIKEVGSFLSGECSFEEMSEELKKNTRNYAKRQLTWFRSDKRITWIDANRPVEDIVDDITKYL